MLGLQDTPTSVPGPGMPSRVCAHLRKRLVRSVERGRGFGMTFQCLDCGTKLPRFVGEIKV